MAKIGIYPGTFDPLTFGHIDVIKRALKNCQQIDYCCIKRLFKRLFIFCR